MDESRGTSTGGAFEPTPEATPTADDVTPLIRLDDERAQREETAGASQSAGSSTGGKDDGEKIGELTRDVAERLKPVAAVAEDVAARAVSMSTKGLTRLSEILAARREKRAATGADSTTNLDD